MKNRKSIYMNINSMIPKKVSKYITAKHPCGGLHIYKPCTV